MYTLIFISVFVLISLEYICRMVYPMAYIRPTNVLHYLTHIFTNIFYILGYYMGFMTDITSFYHLISRFLSNIFNNIVDALERFLSNIVNNIIYVLDRMVDAIVWICNNTIRLLNYIMSKIYYYIKLTPLYDIFNLMKGGLSLVQSLKGFFIGYKTYLNMLSHYLYDIHVFIWTVILFNLVVFIQFVYTFNSR